VAGGLARLETEEVTTARGREIDGQVDCGKMHGLSIETRRESAGLRASWQPRSDARGGPAAGTILEACRGSEWVQPGLVLGACAEPVQLRKGIGSAERSIFGGGPVRHPPTLQRSASGTIAMTQGEGPEAGPPVSPPLFGPEGLAEAKQRAGLGPRGGPSGGTVTDPKRIDDQSVIGPAGGTSEELGEVRAR
jgi:hypothetical protein